MKQEDPTAIHKDNAAAIMMVNTKRHTECSRHIDIQFFALQEWVERLQVKFYHIPGVVNIADALNRALGW
eukprot:9369672-Ditylum_brightwellii.AAC.1